MRIPALALALLAAALSGSANAGPESKAQLPKLATAAQGPANLAAENAPAAYSQEVVAPVPYADVRKRGLRESPPVFFKSVLSSPRLCAAARPAIWLS